MTSRRDFIKFGAAATASSLFVPRDLFAAYEKEAEAVGNDVVLRCCIMSDVHFDGNPKAKEVERFRRAIDFTYRYSADQPYKNFDALLVVGDMSNHGIESELTLFKKEMDAAIKPGTDTFLCMGNHEFYGGNQAYWQSVFGVEPNRRYERNGFRFIAISPEKGTMKDGDYLYMVDFLDRELADAYKADPEKPIFVFQHYPVSPTVYGGRGFDDWGAEDFFDTLQKYPTVVNFSGHTHYPINDPRCAWQGCFSAFGTGTLSYVCHGCEGPGRFQMYLPEDSRYAQFYIMEVRRDNSVTILPYDLVTNSFFDIVYRVAKPGAVDSYDYTDKRYFNSQKPTWREGTTVKASCVDAYAGTVEFRQATCPDVVLGYRVDLREFDEKKNEWSEYGSRYFWSDYFLKDMPDVIKGTLLDLPRSIRSCARATRNLRSSSRRPPTIPSRPIRTRRTRSRTSTTSRPPTEKRSIARRTSGDSLRNSRSAASRRLCATTRLARTSSNLTGAPISTAPPSRPTTAISCGALRSARPLWFRKTSRRRAPFSATRRWAASS